MFISNLESKKRPCDFPLLVCTVALVCFGIIMVFSASYYYALLKYDNAFEYVIKQILGAIGGFFVMWLISRLDYKLLKKYSYTFMIGCILLLIAVLIPGIGIELNGARRWIGYGSFSFQPAEIAKFGIILFMAGSISKKPERLKSIKTGLIPYTILLGLTCGLIMLQPNLSMVICIGAIWFALMVAGGLPKAQVIFLLVAAVTVVSILAFGAGYRSDRMMMFLNPWKDPSGKGYQVIQSLYSIASGGLFGTGLGNSRQKMLFLPYRESDFIFAIIAEEFGFVGCIFFFALYLFIFWRGVRIALNCDDSFGSFVAIGVVASVSSQMILNVCVAIKLAPATGVTLPFVSAGLTSLIVMMCNIGLLLNISRHCSPRRRSE